jgi:ketosteroid isomerase-like protein
MMPDYKQLATQYFEAFSRKDIAAVTGMFERDVILSDWEITAFGKEEVVKANQRIFDGVDTIHVTPKDIYLDGQVIIADLKILVNNKDELKVVDIIHYNVRGEITRITAFKG